jgi:hypothetical protein
MTSVLESEVSVCLSSSSFSPVVHLALATGRETPGFTNDPSVCLPGATLQARWENPMVLHHIQFSTSSTVVYLTSLRSVHCSTRAFNRPCIFCPRVLWRYAGSTCLYYSLRQGKTLLLL